VASNADLQSKIVEHSATLGRTAPDVAEATNAELSAVAKALKAEVVALSAEKSEDAAKKAPVVLPDNAKAKGRAPGHYVSKGCSITAPGKRVLEGGAPVTDGDLALEHRKVLQDKGILELQR
jgi:hypothetical protein